MRIRDCPRHEGADCVRSINEANDLLRASVTVSGLVALVMAAVVWHGAHIRRIRRSRQALGRALGMPTLILWGIHIAWTAKQWSRVIGLVAPGYVVRIKLQGG